MIAQSAVIFLVMNTHSSDASGQIISLLALVDDRYSKDAVVGW